MLAASSHFERRGNLIVELQACSSSKNLERGRILHKAAVLSADCSHVYVANTLIHMYAKCGSMHEARAVFDNMEHPNEVSYIALMLGYAENGEGETTLDLFPRIPPNGRTTVAALKACSDLATKENKRVTLTRGKQLHLLALEIGCDSNIYVQGTLVDMYAKCGSMKDAREVFDNSKEQDVVMWTALILGYAENGEGEVALGLFSRMRREGCVPNAFTFSAVLIACGALSALELGRTFHTEISKAKENNAILATCLLDFYVKCGSLIEAKHVFDSAPKDLITWNVLLGGYSSNGQLDEAFSLFNKLRASLRPDSITFNCILIACSHSGLVDKGKCYFEEMHTKYGIPGNVEHFNCMTDLLGRANQLDEAMSLLRNMAPRPNCVTWMTLLGTCRRWKNVQLGKLAFESLIWLEGDNARGYVLMANIYGNRGMLADQAKIQAMGMQLQSLNAKPDVCWWTSNLGTVHTFYRTCVPQAAA